MRNFFIITNHIKDPDLAKTGRIREIITGCGGRCSIYDSAAEGGSKKMARYTDPALVPEDTECVLVLGGDGTLLNAARDLKETDYPLLGINLGTLGYLAEIEMNDILEWSGSMFM